MVSSARKLAAPVAIKVMNKQRIRFLVVLRDVVARGRADFAARQSGFGQCHVQQMIAARRLRPKNLVVPIKIHAPAVAALGRNLFKTSAVGPEANHAFADLAKMGFSVTGINVAAAVADRCVNPAVRYGLFRPTRRINEQAVQTDIGSCEFGVQNPEEFGKPA